MRKLLLLLFAFSSFGAGFAQVSYTVTQLDSRNGLSNSSVNCIFQDSDSLLWLATWDGLNMYDGTSFYVYNYKERGVAGSIGNSLVQQITEDNRKNIWITTIEGITRIEKKTGSIRNYYYAEERSRHVTEDQFFLVPDTSGNIYCFARSRGFLRYDASKDTFLHVPLPVHESDVQRIFFDGQKRLWVLDRSGNLSWSNISGSQENTAPKMAIAREVATALYVNDAVFFTDRNHRLFTYSYRQGVSRALAQLAEPVKAIEYYNDHYFLATGDRGLTVLDQHFKPADYLDQHLQGLANLHILSIKKGSRGILWCATDGNGILKISPRRQLFRHGIPAESDIYANKQVRAFCEVGDSLWVATKGNGIVSIPYDEASGTYLSEKATSIEGLDNKSVYCLFKGYENLVYVGSDGVGISVYDASNRDFVHWKQIEGSHKYYFESVYAILQDADSSIWLGTSGYGLIHLKLKKKNTGSWSIDSYKSYTFDGGMSGPANDIIYSLAYGSNRGIWVGCRYGGLSYFDRRTKLFQHFKAFEYEGSLSHNDVLAVHVDFHHVLWVGTSYGLNSIAEQALLSGEKPGFLHYTTEEGMPSNTIHAITSDAEGNTWCSTNGGIVKISGAKKDKIVCFKESDGLQSNEFSDGSVWQNDKGYVFFGGINGFNYFRPEEIWFPAAGFNLLLSDFTIGGKPVDEVGIHIIHYGSPQHVASTYIAEKRNNFFQLRFRPLDYQHPEKVVISYFLVGLDQEWKSLESDRKILYSNLTPGSYRLMIRWSLGDGTWSPEATAFHIRVKPHPAFSPPALLAYLLLLLTAFYLYYRYRKSRRAIHNQLVLEHALRQKDRELHQEKLDFFTNVAHELQTPLTLIAGSLERYQHKRTMRDGPEGEKNYFLSLVQQQAAKLTYLVQQLLDFRRAENGHLRVYPETLNVSQLLMNIVELFTPYAGARQLVFRCRIEPDIHFITDKDKLEKIMYNLLSNAVKHATPGAGEIGIELMREPGDRLCMTIENPGHIPQSRFDNIFEKFYILEKEADGKHSSGIGLAFTRELVRLLQGEITVSGSSDRVQFQFILDPYPVIHSRRQRETHPRPELPSHLLRSATEMQINEKQRSVAENNKRSLINNLEEGTRQSILVVEDDDAIRYLLRDTLEDTYIIYEAENGREAIEVIKRVIPDLIVSDIMMPEMDGLQLCNRVKETPETCHIPFILLTAKSDIDQKNDGYQAGADAYIPKPFHIPHLLIRIRRLLAHREKLQLFLENHLQPGSPHPHPTADPEDRQFLQHLLELVTRHIDNDELSADYLEKETNLSKKQLYRRTKSLTGMTPTEFIRHSRLQQAAHYLRSTQYTVSEIFYMTGFSNQSYFFREFKKEFQKSPLEYRKSHKI